MREAVYQRLIIAELAGEIDQKDQHLLQSWLEENEENRLEYAKFKKIWILGETADFPVSMDVDQAFDQFKSRIQPAKVRNLRPPIWQSSWMRAAAVLLLVAVGLWMVLQPGQGPQELVWTTISTQGEMRPVNLPDGSIIWLNKNSKISFPETFEERSVRLEGEAFFDVAKLDGKKFFIQAGDTKTEVLGTTFNIRAYHKEPIVEVTVFSGKVSLESAQDEAKEVILMPKDKGVYYKTGQKLEKTENADSNALAWKSGQLKFEQITLREILPTIVRFYQIKVEADSPSILNCTFTGSFEKTNLEEVLESIAFALNLEVKKQDNTYRLSGKGCN